MKGKKSLQETKRRYRYRSCDGGWLGIGREDGRY